MPAATDLMDAVGGSQHVFARYRCVHAWEEGVQPSEVKSSEYDLASGTATSNDAASFIFNTATIMSDAVQSWKGLKLMSNMGLFGDPELKMISGRPTYKGYVCIAQSGGQNRAGRRDEGPRTFHIVGALYNTILVQVRPEVLAQDPAGAMLKPSHIPLYMWLSTPFRLGKVR